MISTEETVAKATEFKDRGNKAFKESHFQESIDLYTQAIDLKSDEKTFYTNRAAVRKPSKTVAIAFNESLPRLIRNSRHMV